MNIDISPDGNIPDQFAQIAASLPAQTAIALNGEAISYAELAQQAGKITQFFTEELGETPTPIAVLHSSQKRLIPLLLGIVNAGHIYAAIQANDPPERIASLLKSLDAPFLIVSDPALAQLAQQTCPTETKLISVQDAHSQGKTPRKVRLGPDSCAVITYTSGSTGEPKGILRTHKLILHQAKTYQEQFGIGPADRMLAIRPISASASLNEIFVPLLTGATIVPFDLREDGLAHLPQALKTQSVTMMRPPIQAMRTLLETLPEGETFPGLRYVFATGDVLYKRDIDQLRRILSPEAVIVHQVSMSETGLLAVNKIHHDTVLDSEIVPAGQPVRGKEVLILDEDGRELPPGEVGEIHVRSQFSFPGYWRESGLPSARFVPDPADPTRKVFATGDLGRIRPDGQLELVGRKDWRIKIRGYSVDLAAVEHILMANPKIQRAVVSAASGPDGQKKMVAYVLPANGQSIEPAEITQIVASQFPDYMIPALVMLLKEMPLTHTGKIDRKALPAPDWQNAVRRNPYQPPRDATEHKLAELWQKAFKLAKVGIQDNFFDLGGDSLLAASLFLDVEKAFGQRFPLSVLLKYGTIAELAALLRKEGKAADLEHMVALRASGSNPPLFLAPGAGSDAITFIELAAALGKNQPVYILEDFKIGTSHSIYAEGVEKAATEFIRAIRQVQAEGPYYLGGHSFGGVVAFEIALQLLAAGEKIGFLMVLDSTAPIRTPKAALDNRLSMHWQNLKGKPLSEKLAYLSRRFDRQIRILSRIPWVQKIYRIKFIEERLWVDRHRYPLMARHGYTPNSYPGDLIVYRAFEKPVNNTWDNTEAWPRFIQGKTIYCEVPGNHLSIIRQPHVATLAKLLTEHLEQAFAQNRAKKEE